MGIHLNLAVIVLDWTRRHRLAGPTLTLGVQDIAFTPADFQRAIDPSRAATARGDDPKPWTAEQFFASLGLTDVSAMDVSDFEGADVIFDLNEPTPPTALLQRFGLILNGGTLEHVFHVPNALSNLSAMLRPGGAILHVLPCNNWVDHGFYQFSPTLIFDYYSAMGYEVLESAMAIFNPRRHGGHQWEVRPASIGFLGAGRAGQLDDRTYLLTMLVRRGAASLERAIPVQSFYARGPARPRGGPRWFSPYELNYGTRVDHPNRGIWPLRTFVRDEGHAWLVSVPDLALYANSDEHPTRSPLVVLEDKTALGPAHASHAAIRLHGGGAFSHWGEAIYLSTTDNTDPNTNGRSYVAVLPSAFDRA